MRTSALTVLRAAARYARRCQDEMMKQRVVTLFIGMLFAVPANADHPAIGYWLVEVSSLTNEVARAGSLAKVEQATLEEKAECHGFFTVNCCVRLHMRTVQVRIKAEEEGGCLTYAMSLSWPPVKRPPVETRGQIMLSDMFAAKEGWQQDKYVLVIKRLNLKE